MAYLQVKDLKKTADLWRRLAKDRELIITKDGQPRAIIIGIEPEELESASAEIRRALFSATVGRIRERSSKNPPPGDLVENAIKASRHS
jgi:antitoxin (DNA-binding transcriptional repressor) of toxin-antitoxin stability system